MKSRYPEILAKMREKIIRGEFQPSQNLTEISLAEEFGVSRNTIKKILLSLEKDNLVSIEPNKGAQVKSFSIEEVLELLDIREAVECLVVKNAAEHISNQQIKKLSDTLQKMKNCIDNNDLMNYSANNGVFHQIIYDACTNKSATETTISLKNQIHRYNFRTILYPGRGQDSYDEHARLLDALTRHDPSGASEALSDHIHHIRDILQNNYTLLF